MADDCGDEEVIFENSALHKHLVDAGVANISVERTGKKSQELSEPKPETENPSFKKNVTENLIQFWDPIYKKLKIHFSLDLLLSKLHSYQSHNLLQKIIQSKSLEDDDKIFLENYISSTRESADLTQGKEAILFLVYPLLGIILIYMLCLFSPISAAIFMNPVFNLIRLATKCYILLLISVVVIVVCNVLVLQYTGQQVLDFLQQAESSITLQKKSLRLIQEVELVRKGFTLVSSQISVSKNENAAPINQRLCPELRRLLFLASRSNMLLCRKTTSLLLERYPLIDEVDKASTYLANIPLEDYGPSLQQVKEEEEEKKDEQESKEKNLSKLTDDFSVTALKAMLYLYGMQQSELIRRLALCFCTNAQLENQKGKVNSLIFKSIIELNQNLNVEFLKLGSSYEFHRCSFQERDAKSSPPINQKQTTSSVSDLYMAIHSLDLHLRAALHRSYALSTELESFSEAEVEMLQKEEGLKEKLNHKEIQEKLNLKEKLWYEQLESVKAELEACRGCWEVGLDKINKIYKKKQEQVTKLSPSNEKPSAEEKKAIISADDIDPVIVDEVFEDYTDPDKDEFECNYVHLSPEEREKREQDREESRRMMFELRNVIAVRANDMERREEVALKRNQVGKNQVKNNENNSLCDSTHSSTDAEQSDDSLHTDSLQSDSLQSDLPCKDVDPMQQSGNLNEDLVDEEDLLISDDEFSSNKPKDLSHSHDSSVKSKISWSQNLSLNSETEKPEIKPTEIEKPFFLHESADSVASDHLSDLHLRNLLFSPGSDAPEILNTDIPQENSMPDSRLSDQGLSALKNASPIINNSSSTHLNEFHLSSSQPPLDESFSFILHPDKESSSKVNSRSPSLTPTHRASSNTNHINNNNASSSSSLCQQAVNPDPNSSSIQSTSFFLHSNDDGNGDNDGDDDENNPLSKRSLQGTNLLDLQERWATNSGGAGLSLTRNIAALASARCKEQINMNIQTFGDEEEEEEEEEEEGETFADDDSIDDDDNGLKKSETK